MPTGRPYRFVVGAGLARDIATRVNAAFYGNLAAPTPSGLVAVSGTQTAVGAYTDLDVFAEAISKAETVGASVIKGRHRQQLAAAGPGRHAGRRAAAS